MSKFVPCLWFDGRAEEAIALSGKPEQRDRMMAAVMQMKRIDAAAIRRAISASRHSTISTQRNCRGCSLKQLRS